MESGYYNGTMYSGRLYISVLNKAREKGGKEAMEITEAYQRNFTKKLTDS
jgi:hypothetical protein